MKKLGFNDQFINRPKIGFSIKDNPKDIEMLTDKALKFCLENGFLKVDFDKLGGRDQQYLKMSALGFWIWHRKFIGLE